MNRGRIGLSILLCFASVRFAPNEQEERPGKRVWQAHVRYEEKGRLERPNQQNRLRDWRKLATANYTLITYETVGEGSTWEDASVRYSDSGVDEFYDENGKYMEARWSGSDRLSAKSLEEQVEKQEQEMIQSGGLSPRSSFGLGGLILHRSGKKVYVLEVPSIGAGGVHKGALTIWERGKGTRDEDLIASTGGGVVGNQPVEETREEKERRKEQGERKLMPQMEDFAETQKEFAEKQKEQVEKLLRNLPKEPPKMKPGQKELTPEMQEYIEKMMQGIPDEEVEKEMEAIQESEDALIVATLQQAGAKELGDRKGIAYSRSWGPTKYEKSLYGEEVRITHTLTWSFSQIPEDVEAVIIPSDDYDRWLPRAGKDEDTPGNSIDVMVVLQKKGEPGKKPAKTPSSNSNSSMSRRKGVFA